MLCNTESHKMLSSQHGMQISTLNENLMGMGISQTSHTNRFQKVFLSLSTTEFLFSAKNILQRKFEFEMTSITVTVMPSHCMCYMRGSQ